MVNCFCCNAKSPTNNNKINDNINNIFNDLIFGDSQILLQSIGGTGALRTLKKDNRDSITVVRLIDELMLCSSIIEMVNYTNNEEGLKNVSSVTELIEEGLSAEEILKRIL